MTLTKTMFYPLLTGLSMSSIEEIDRLIERAETAQTVEGVQAWSLLAMAKMMRIELEDKLNPIITVDTDPSLFRGYM
jgi:hypothetical protein